MSSHRIFVPSIRLSHRRRSPSCSANFKLPPSAMMAQSVVRCIALDGRCTADHRTAQCSHLRVSRTRRKTGSDSCVGQTFVNPHLGHWDVGSQKTASPEHLVPIRASEFSPYIRQFYTLLLGNQ